MSYYKKGAAYTTHVWYTLLDGDGASIRSYDDQPCFSAITYNGIPRNTRTIKIRHNKKFIPYSDDSVKRWIDDVNEVGFPCRVVLNGGKDEHHFYVEMKDYEWKAHLISTLMLIRALYEGGINEVPSTYFNMMDADVNRDKFLAIQASHKHKHYGNTNHMITYEGNGKALISRGELFDKYAGTGKDVFIQGNIMIPQSALWRSGVSPHPGCRECQQMLYDNAV